MYILGKEIDTTVLPSTNASTNNITTTETSTSTTMTIDETTTNSIKSETTFSSTDSTENVKGKTSGETTETKMEETSSTNKICVNETTGNIKIIEEVNGSATVSSETSNSKVPILTKLSSSSVSTDKTDVNDETVSFSATKSTNSIFNATSVLKNTSREVTSDMPTTHRTIANESNITTSFQTENSTFKTTTLQSVTTTTTHSSAKLESESPRSNSSPIRFFDNLLKLLIIIVLILGF